MRLRYVKGSKELIASHEGIVHNAKELRGKWREYFGNENPVHLEIGMGKGQFLSTLAKQNPDINYIGIEKYEAVMLRALEKKTTSGTLRFFASMQATLRSISLRAR